MGDIPFGIGMDRRKAIDPPIETPPHSYCTHGSYGKGGAVEDPEGDGAPGTGGGRDVPHFGGGKGERESVGGSTSVHREAEARERVERAKEAARMVCEERNGMERDRASPEGKSTESLA